MKLDISSLDKAVTRLSEGLRVTAWTNPTRRFAMA